MNSFGSETESFYEESIVKKTVPTKNIDTETIKYYYNWAVCWLKMNCTF